MLNWMNHPAGMEAHNGQGINFVEVCSEEDGRYQASIRPNKNPPRCKECGHVLWINLGSADSMHEAMALCEAEAKQPEFVSLD
jgi:hypothetical protein